MASFASQAGYSVDFGALFAAVDEALARGKGIVFITGHIGAFDYAGQMIPLRGIKTVLVTAHGNSLRALYKYLNSVSREEILELNIPTGIPLLFELNDDLTVKSFRYLGDPEAARKAAEAVANQGKAK